MKMCPSSNEGIERERKKVFRNLFTFHIDRTGFQISIIIAKYLNAAEQNVTYLNEAQKVHSNIFFDI